MLEKMTEQDSRAVVEKAYHMFKGESGKVSHANLKSLAMELGSTSGAILVVMMAVQVSTYRRTS